MSSVLAFVLVLGALIFVHELGHFLVAKLFRIKVLRFSPGFGPKLVGRRWGETEYLISLLPLGGYVKMLGEDPEEEVKEEEEERAFWNQPPSRRGAIVSAGPVANLLFASLLFAFIFAIGIPHLAPTIGEVADGFPAKEAGIKPGDRVIAIDGKEVRYWSDLLEEIPRSGGRELHLTIRRDERVLTVAVTPKAVKKKTVFGEEKVIYQIGIVPKGETIIEKVSPIKAIGKGFSHTLKISYMVINIVIKMVEGVISPKTLGGPLLIAQMAGEHAQKGIISLLFFTAVLSVNLGILNLFPIPILDGGQLIIILLESLRGKPISVKKLELVQKVGIVLIILIMAFAFYNDLMRIFSPKGR